MLKISFWAFIFMISFFHLTGQCEGIYYGDNRRLTSYSYFFAGMI